MTDMVRWVAALAPDISATVTSGNVILQTATQRFSFPVTANIVAALQALGTDVEHITASEKDASASPETQFARARTLMRLEALGLVAQSLETRQRKIITCMPLRAPTESRPTVPPKGTLRLAPHALLRRRDNGLSLEAPGAWARIAVHDAATVSLLVPLAEGRTLKDCRLACEGLPADTVDAILCVFHWCGILAGPQEDTGLALHDIALHAATRQGFSRDPIGKTGTSEIPPALAPPTLHQVSLPEPDLQALRRQDPTFAATAAARKSRRTQGETPISTQQVSEFLYRTFHEQGGRRPYPSGGACYPLTAYLALHRCLDMASGLYRYDAHAHVLDMVAETDPALNRILDGAATSAGAETRPQALLILSARFDRTLPMYEGLSYSLILKEVGAVMQTAMLSAAAMDLAACPLGTGDSLAFSKLAQLDPIVETSVGEVMLGTAPTE